MGVVEGEYKRTPIHLQISTASPTTSQSLLYYFVVARAFDNIINMKTILALLAAFASSNVQAYVPPAEQADGTYSVSFDASGQATTKRHEEIFSRPNSAKFRREVPSLTSVVERRDFPSQQVSCTKRDISDHYDYSVVQNCLGTWLNQHTGKYYNDNTVYYCRAGNTLLAICNYPATVYGSSGEIDNFNAIMDSHCGSWKSGYVWIPDWNKTVSVMSFALVNLGG
jgi:hypothetical protein